MQKINTNARSKLKTLKVNQHRDSMIWFYWHPSSFIQIEIKTLSHRNEKRYQLNALCTCRMLIYRCRLLLLIMHALRIIAEVVFSLHHHSHSFALSLSLALVLARSSFGSFHISHLQLDSFVGESEFLCQVRNIVSTKLLISKRNLTISMLKTGASHSPNIHTSHRAIHLSHYNSSITVIAYSYYYDCD